MPNLVYEAYINSPQWKRRRASFMAIRGNGSCKICRARSRLHVHHMSYTHFGDEPDEDLVTLCEPHHALVHNFHRGSGMSLRRATLHIVEREMGKPPPRLTLTPPSKNPPVKKSPTKKQKKKKNPSGRQQRQRKQREAAKRNETTQTLGPWQGREGVARKALVVSAGRNQRSKRRRAKR